MALFSILEDTSQEEEIKEIEDTIYFLYSGINAIKKEISTPLSKPIRKFIRIEGLEQDFLYNFTRFRREELSVIMESLEMREYVVFKNGSIMHREEILIRSLFELATAAKQTTAMEIFGRHPSDQSRAMTYFIHYFTAKFKHLVMNNLYWWHANGFMEGSYHLIQNKIGVARDKKFALFIDCNCCETAIVAGIPFLQRVNRCINLIQVIVHSPNLLNFSSTFVGSKLNPLVQYMPIIN
jgi:hypothetical protein